MAISSSKALALWYRALDAEIGIAIKTDNRRALSNDLYAARKEAADPRLFTLSVMMPPDETEIWICKRRQEDGEPSRRAFRESDIESL